MAAIIVIPFAVLVILMWSSGQALNSTHSGQSNQSFFSWFFAGFFDGLHTIAEVIVQSAKVIAHFMYPALKSAEKAVAGWFAGHATILEWQGNHAHRTSVALSNTVDWAQTGLTDDILAKAKHDAAAQVGKNAYTKAPPLPQRRLTQHEVDVEFRRLIDSLTPAEKLSIDPKGEWDPEKWRKWLGIIPALGSTIVHPHPTHPIAKPNPQPVAPPQPAILPHTDDHPNPDPGTQHVPGVVSGRDKWARGQIVKLNKKQTSLLHHLGPLAFLALPIAAITTLIGLLECKNFGKFSRAICHIPTNAFSNLLGLLLDIFILADICEVMKLVKEGAGLIETPLADFIGSVGGALCHGDFPEKVWPGLNYSTAAPELNTLAL